MSLRSAVNHHLRPAAISVLAAEPAPPEFDARLSAILRVYVYRILNRRAPAALDRGRVWRVAPPLDAEAMREGARHLVGHHDFTTFRDRLCQARSPLRTLDALEVGRSGEEIRIEARARSFLHRQVRNMAGPWSWSGSAAGSPTMSPRRSPPATAAPAARPPRPRAFIWSRSNILVASRV